MREPEGIETPLPGSLRKGPGQNAENHTFAIVEVGGSSPLTSTTTKGQVRGLVHDVSSASSENGLGPGSWARPGCDGSSALSKG